MYSNTFLTFLLLYSYSSLLLVVDMASLGEIESTLAIESVAELSEMKGLRIMSQNCRSLPRQLNMIRAWGWLPEVLCLQETWVNKQGLNLQIPPARLLLKNREKRGGGLAIYLSHALEFVEIKTHDAPEALEAQAVRITLPSGAELAVVNLYRPPKGDLERGLEILRELMQHKEIASISRVIMCGDLNINCISESRALSKYTELLSDLGLAQRICLPTRIAGTSQTLIDHVLTKNVAGVSFRLATHLSDHHAVGLLLPRGIEAKVGMEKSCKLKAWEMQALDDKLKGRNWDAWLEEVGTTANERFNALQELLFREVKEMLAKRPTNCKNRRKIPICPWVTAAVLKAREHTNNCGKRCKGDGQDAAYKEAKKQLRREIRKAKACYYQSKLQACRNDPQGTWGVINEVLGRTGKGNGPPVKLNVNGQSIDDDREIAKSLNEYFSTVGETVAAEIPQSQRRMEEYLAKARPGRSGDTFKFQLLEEWETKSLLKALAPKTSFADDLISNKLLKICYEGLAKPMTHVINAALAEGVMPEKAKIARTIYLHKGGDKTEIGNYRPISLVSGLGKVIDKVAARQLKRYMEKNGLLYDDQFGFRKGHSTEHAVIKLHTIAEQCRRDKKFGFIFFADTQKAFNCVQPELLGKKLQCYGVHGRENNFFLSYLKGRKQFAEVRESRSSLQDVNIGCPQGGVYSADAYITFNNDFPDAIELLAILYADDSTAITVKNTWEELCAAVGTEMQNIEDWFKANKLKLNASKSKFMLLLPPKYANVEFKVVVDGREVERITGDKTVRFLGVLIDEKLSYSAHYDKVLSKVKSGVAALLQSKNVLSREAKKLVYEALIQSHISYAASVWGNAITGGKKAELLKWQKKAVRAIENARYNAHTDPIFQRLEILKFTDVLQLQAVTTLKKLQLGRLPAGLDGFFWQCSPSNTKTRSGALGLMYPVRHFSDVQVLQEMTKAWNRAPEAVKQAASVKRAKSLCKQQTLETYETVCIRTDCPECSNK